MADEEPRELGDAQYQMPLDNPNLIEITLTHGGLSQPLLVGRDATITDLSMAVEHELHIPIANQKFIVPKLGLQKPPFKDPKLPAAQLVGKKIILMGTAASAVASLTSASATASQAVAKREAALAHQRRHQPKAFTTHATTTEETTYTFMAIRPLPHLPHPEKSQKFLERLKADPGIVAAMRKHKFRVGLLTEMDPLSYTEATHEGTTRILGLNRNKGEAVELRLRTDAYDGYRDYKTIRNTLCHELAHNVHSDHDRNFWDLCHEIEREVARADWRKNGRSVGGEDLAEVYEPSEEVAYDHGGWTGGEFVLGGGANGTGGPALSRREIIARATEERMKKMNNDGPDGGKPRGAGEGSSS
ncbi:Ubiquitin and WLM domain-containing metalloprotease [Apiospora rasikravindrae]|uniref:Ubiquitin and WLM domain-containing metalloprotease n=1 Tax=Apiospora rasikravindrae TaxID=990691 RepID=A0ABR1SWH0_9PEZI